MIYVGTSGWQYDSWRNRFYKGVPKRAWLEHYSERFSTVELNNSFYQLPKEESFRKWKEESAEDFIMVVKTSRFITHIRRMRDCRDPVKLFWSRATKLGKKLGPVLFQFPPRFNVDPDRLQQFMKVLPRNMVPAFEFRDRSWETDEVYDILDRAGAAFVLADTPGVKVPDVVTGGWSYVRFHKGRRTTPFYSRSKLRWWADRIAAMKAKDVWIFFNNDEQCAAPRDARILMDLLEERGQKVAPPPGKAAA
jgi:uncharacterized protein YecE (DUF72 family)